MKNRFQIKPLLATFTMMVAFMLYGLNVAAQCNPDGTNPIIVNCPTNLIMQLDPGQCSIPISPSLSATDNCPGQVNQISHISTNTVDDGYGCDQGVTRFYQIFTSTSPTPMSITDVNFSVDQFDLTSPSVKINVYVTGFSATISDWELIGSTSKQVIALGSTQALISTDDILNGEEFAIEIIAPSSTSGTVIGISNAAQSAPTFIVSQACGIDILTDLSTVVGSMASIVGFSTTSSDALIIVPSGGNPYEVGTRFMAGSYALSYMAIDASGNTFNCAFNLTVDPVANPVTSITCNDLVNISLDNECKAHVGADDILEGGPYGCYDNYIVEIFNLANQPIGDSLDATYIGQVLKVQVTGPNSNSCWGEIKVEDKNKPQLDCFDIYTTCSGDLAPGSALPNMITYGATIGDSVISAGAASSNVYEIEVFGLKDVTLNDLDVLINVSHTNPSDLTATLTSPSGDLIWLFTNPGSGVGCTNPDMFVTLTSSATQNHTDLQNSCEATSPAHMGRYTPQESFGVFSGDPTGTWVLTINDLNAGNGGKVNSLELVVKQSGGTIPFPTMNTVSNVVKVGPNTYRVDGIDACGPVTISYIDEIEEMDCASPYHKIIKRTYNAVDESGNTAISCMQRVYVYRNGLASLIFPPNYDGIDQPTFSCSEYGMTIPPPTTPGAGMPTGDFCDNIQIFPPEDTRIDVCAKSYKLIRKWKVIEWCSSQVIEHTQIIKVEDKQGPKIDCPDDVTISTDPLECSASYSFDAAVVSDYGCSTEDQITLVVSYYFAPNGLLPNDAIFTAVVGTTIMHLPLGVTYIKYKATDDCGNMNECTTKVTVEDQVPPVAVCDQFTNISLGSDGTALVNAITFDDYSYDNCELRSFQARKMTNACPAGTTQFVDKLLFCCEEIGQTIMIAFEVTDAQGLKNTCMVEATIDDKLPPYIVCPEDVTIDCFEDFTDLELTGEPEAFDNCEIKSIDYDDSNDDLDNCGEGVIRRTWEIKDTRFAASCTQTITVKDQNPFTGKDIDWPNDYDATTCKSSLDPEDLPVLNAYPRYSDKKCSLVSHEYTDQVFTFVDGSCEKILRTWTVIDWCTYNKNGGGIYTDLQIIKLTNNIAPTIDSGCMNTTVDIFGEDCKGDVEQTIKATDDCTPTKDLVFNYTIDENNDGVGVLITGSDSTFTRRLGLGEHKVTWEVEDKCGNTEMCMYILRVRDGKKPTPYCLTTVTTVVMPSSQMIEIWAKDFDYGSYDNCTDKKDLVFSFTANQSTMNRTFSCADIIDGQEMYIPITMYVHDAAGNSDFCSIGLILQDGIGDVCDDVNRFGISGKLVTEENEPIGESLVAASVVTTETMVSSQMTETNGLYTINVAEGDDVNITSDKDDAIMNGISTLDLVLIQRHILALSSFTSPYKVIASDVNNDSKVSAADLVALRKVILGIENTFPNGQKAWRFADASQSFNNNAKPFPFSEEITFMGVQNQNTEVNFIGMKIGDVNGSAKSSLRSEDSDNRSANPYTFNYEVNNDNEYSFVDVYGSNDLTISGMQALIEPLGGEIVGIEPGILAIGQGDFVLANGAIKIAHAANGLINTTGDEVLFTLVVKSASQFGGITTSINEMSSELYTQDYEARDIEMKLRNSDNEFTFSLGQNTPNPFTDFTSVSFVLPDAGSATLEVFDINGRSFYKQTKQFQKGENIVDVRLDEISASGIMYYQLTFGAHKATKKMVVVK